MNEVFRRRLIGLAVLLALVFVLSLLLPKDEPSSAAGDAPSTTVSLLEADSPSPADPAEPSPPQPVATAAAPASERVDVPADAPASPPSAPVLKPAAALKLSPTVTPPAAKHETEKKPAAAPPQPLLSPPKPKLAESVTKASPPPVVAAAAAASGWYVQIGSFSDPGKAATIVSLLQKIGYKAESSKTVTAAGAMFYRVRLGAFPDEGAAQEARQHVARQGYPEARVISESGVAR